MSKKMPWAGPSSAEARPKSADNHPPAAGSHYQKAINHGGDQGGKQFVHESLRGEVHPDKPGTARPG